MRKLILIIVYAALFLSACGSNDDSTQAGQNNAPTFSGEVDIVTPPNGMTVYSETLFVTGTMFGAQQVTFTIQLVDPEGNVIAQADVNTTEGDWSIEIPHGYTGDPTEITVRAVPADIPDAGVYDSATIVIADPASRPAGIFGSIASPADGETVGGDLIPVAGRVSGVFENMLTLELMGEGGAVIAEQTVTITYANFIDDTPWQAELATNGYTGTATIRAYALNAADGSAIPLGAVNVIIEATAG